MQIDNTENGRVRFNIYHVNYAGQYRRCQTCPPMAPLLRLPTQLHLTPVTAVKSSLQDT
jgi:hypothetical protein